MSLLDALYKSPNLGKIYHINVIHMCAYVNKTEPQVGILSSILFDLSYSAQTIEQ